MHFNARLISQNKISAAIVVFLCAMGAMHVCKPALIYARDGSFRPFGLGYRHKTVVPAWAAAVGLAVLSYLCVLFCALVR